MRVKNISNAFVRIETGNHVLLCDVWLSKGIFDGAWSPAPFVQDPNAALKDATHVFCSHIHYDHADAATISLLPRSTPIIIPDMYPNNILEMTFKKLGFSDIRMIPMAEITEIAPGLSIEPIKPMNTYGHETEQVIRDGNIGGVAVDAGAIIYAEEKKLVLLSDNSPYYLEAAGPSAERMKNADLLAFPYNGYAQDFPVCYINMSEDERRQIALRRSKKRAELQDKVFCVLQPKAMMPYSSDFAVAGPMAQAFADILPREWTDKFLVSERYAKLFNVQTFVLFEGDHADAMQDGWDVSHIMHPLERPSIRDFARAMYSPIPNTRYRFAPVKDFALLTQDVQSAMENMFAAMEKRQLHSDWVLGIELLDAPDKGYYIDFEKKSLLLQKPSDRKISTCLLEANFLNGLVNFRSHWDDAQVAYNLLWKREPNEMNVGLYQSIVFLHKRVPQNKPLVY